MRFRAGVAERVVDEIPQQDADECPLAGHRQRRSATKRPVDGHLASDLFDEREATGYHLLDDLLPINGLGQAVTISRIDTGQCQELRGNPLQSTNAVADVALGARARLNTRCDQHGFPLGAYRGKRRAELVRCIRREPALVLEGLAQAREQAVHRLDERPHFRRQMFAFQVPEVIGIASTEVPRQLPNRAQRVPDGQRHRHEQHGQHQHPWQELSGDEPLHDLTTLTSHLADSHVPGTVVGGHLVDAPWLAA